jgi:GNAT superfamily N-acetyltransferase
MDEQKIENIELSYLTVGDFESLKSATLESYGGVLVSFWKREHIERLTSIFSEGQVVIKIDGQLAGCALSLIVDYDKIDDNHTYADIIEGDKFKNHDPEGDVLYGIDVFIKPEFRGLRLGRRLYDYRKELCENLNLKTYIRLRNTYKR